MKSGRIARVNELLRREIATAFYRIFGERELDLSSVTVTQVDTSPDLRHARVRISIRGDPATQESTLRLVRRERTEFQRILGKNVVLKYNPQLRFEMDHSLEEGDRVLDLIRELEQPKPDSDEVPEPTEDRDASPDPS
jgi:ribosome-binding factor A